MATDERTASLNRLAIEQSARILLLADAQKFSGQVLVVYGRIQAEKFLLLTDDRLSAQKRRLLSQNKFQLLICPNHNIKKSETAKPKQTLKDQIRP